MKKYLVLLLVSILGLSCAAIAQEETNTIPGRILLETENLKLVELPNHRQAVYYINEQGKVRLMGQVGKIRAGTELFHWGNATPEQAESWDKAGKISPDLLNRLKVDNNFGALGGGFYASLSRVDSMSYGNTQIILRIPKTIRILLNTPTYGMTGDEWVKVIAQLDKVGISALQNHNMPTWFNIIDADALTREHVAKNQDWKASFERSSDKGGIIEKFPDIYTSPSTKIEINRYLYYWKALSSNDPARVYAAFRYFTTVKDAEAIDYSLALIDPAYKGPAMQELIKSYQSMNSAEKSNLLNSQNLKSGPLFPEILKLAMRETASEIRQSVLLAMMNRTDAEATAYVKAGLQDPDDNVRRYAYYSLNNRKDPEALQLLRQGLKDPSVDVRSMIISISASRTSPEAMAIVREAMKDPEPRIRMTVMGAIYSRRDQASLELLKIGIRDSNEGVRSTALQVAVQRKGMMSLDIFRYIMSGTDVGKKTLVMAMLNDRNDSESLKYLMNAIKDPNAHIRAAAIKSLGTRKGNFTPIFEAAIKDSNAEVRAAVMSALTGKTDRKSFEIIMQVINSPEPEVRVVGINALAGRSDQATARVLMNAMKDENGDVRQAATEAAVNLKGNDFTDMVKLAMADSNEWVRFRVVNVLRDRQDDFAFEILKTAMTDENTTLRFSAMRKLAEFRTTAAIDHLKDVMLNSPNPNMRYNATIALQGIGQIPANVAVSMATSDEPPPEKTNAQKFNEKMGHLRTKVTDAINTPRCEAVFRN